MRNENPMTVVICLMLIIGIVAICGYAMFSATKAIVTEYERQMNDVMHQYEEMMEVK